ncbi:hypothetical protein RRG08_010233 [Elysia crispata]|uniref:Uncharacterized protein n=1 Tax=Elysia crispata TaxID=231223 RepID=A0AAE0YZY3_9GAST|nr:hypothetical protein RRG08_010233 [Elysia crispata]
MAYSICHVTVVGKKPNTCQTVTFSIVSGLSEPDLLSVSHQPQPNGAPTTPAPSSPNSPNITGRPSLQRVSMVMTGCSIGLLVLLPSPAQSNTRLDSFILCNVRHVFQVSRSSLVQLCEAAEKQWREEGMRG